MRGEKLFRKGCGIAISGGALAFTGCVQVSTQPIRVEPIYIEITVNHKVQQELDSIFAEIDQASETTRYVPLDSDKEDSNE